MESVHTGSPPPVLDVWETKAVYFHNFLDLSDAKGDRNYVNSPPFNCFGHKWRVRIYPGGDEEGQVGWISIFLGILSKSEKVTIDWRLTLMSTDGEEFSGRKIKGEANTFTGKARCGEDVILRSDLVENPSRYLCHGSLLVKVMMKLSSEGSQTIAPQCSLQNNMDFLLREDSTDVAFDVRGVKVYAHKCIIKKRAKSLYAMCEKFSKPNPMIIDDVDPRIFRIMIRSLYGRSIVPEEWLNYNKQLLQAATKYGFANVKSEAERWYKKCINFTVENVIDEFIKAVENDCDIVQEAAKIFMAEHGTEILASKSFGQLYESGPLMEEIVAVLENRRKQKDENIEEMGHTRFPGINVQITCFDCIVSSVRKLFGYDEVPVYNALPPNQSPSQVTEINSSLYSSVAPVDQSLSESERIAVFGLSVLRNSTKR